MRVKPLLILALLITSFTEAEPKQKPVDLTIEMHEGAGFFAEVHKVVQTLLHFENRGFTNVYVDWRGEFFPYKDAPHENGWDLFFEPIAPTSVNKNQLPEKITVSSTADFHEMHDQLCTAPWVAYKKYHPYRQFIHNTMNKFITIKPHILKKRDSFYNQKMRERICIGVHARIARAHAWLVPGKKLPAIEDYFNEIDFLLEKHTDQDVVIFVASDSHDAIDQFKKRYRQQVIYIDAYRAHGDKDPCIMYTMGEHMRNNPDVWHHQKHKYAGGESTMLDCLLLAKCDYLIHTTSNLAFFSCYYNPEIEAIYLPKAIPYKQCRFEGNPHVMNKALNPS